MISKDKQYRTRDGREVRIYATDTGHAFEPVHGAVKCEWGWKAQSWSIQGTKNLSFPERADHSCDLIEIRPRIKREYWVNVYEQGVTFHPEKVYADQPAYSARIACVKVVIDCEEGEGL